MNAIALAIAALCQISTGAQHFAMTSFIIKTQNECQVKLSKCVSSKMSSFKFDENKALLKCVVEVKGE